MKDQDNEKDSNLSNNIDSDSSDLIKKFILEDSSNPFIDNLPPEASELMKSILSNDEFMVNKEEKESQKVIDSRKQVESSIPKMDKQTQDLLRRMILQESVVKSVQQHPIGSPEYPLPQISNKQIDFQQTSALEKESDGQIIEKIISSPPPPPPPPSMSSSSPGIPKLTQTIPPISVNSKKLASEKFISPPPPPPPPPKQQTIEIKETIQQQPTTKKINKDLFVINENIGTLFGCQIGSSKKREVIELMQQFSKVEITNLSQSVYSFDDLGVSFYFTESGILQEITISYPFEGQTLKGLKIEDSVERAIELYGNPKMRTGSGAIWPRLAVFLTDDIIITIRLKNS